MLNKSIAGLYMVLCSAAAFAQNTLDNPDWIEEAAPPPPAYSADQLIPIEMPSYVTLKVGIDPAALSVGSDGIVRYVVVMRNASGSVNAVYEGIRCVSDEVKTYARRGSSGEWVAAAQPQWRPVNDNMPSRHAFAIARQGACEGRYANTKPEIITALKLRQKSSK